MRVGYSRIRGSSFKAARSATALVLAALNAACGGGDGTGPSAATIALAGGAQSGSVSEAVTPSPRIEIRDANGNPIAGVAFTVSVQSGGGSITGTPAQTQAGGSTSVGTWTLGPTVGPQSLRVESAGLTPLIIIINAQGLPAIATAAGVPITATGTPGSIAVIQPTIRVADQFGNPISGRTVTVVVTGGGTVSNPAPVTNAEGIASAGTWTLGFGTGSQTVTMISGGSAAPVVFTVATASFSVEIRYLGTAAPPAVQTAVTNAVNKIRQIVIGDVPDQPLNANVSGCIPGAGTITQTIDDIIVYVTVAADDGLGGRLATAGPCLPVRNGAPFLPYLGALDIDQADIASMTSNGTLESVILHELMHTLGYGTLWQPAGPGTNWNFNFLTGAGGQNPIFTGALARQAYVASGGSAPSGVPVENTGGAGTRDSHWRMAAFGNELMVGFIQPGFRPVSAVTIQSMADLGYTVSLQVADQFSVISGQAIAGAFAGPLISLGDDIRPPRYVVDDHGQPIRLPAPIPLAAPPPRR